MAYWRYIALQESIRVFKQSLEVAQAQLDDIEARIEVGDLPSNEAAGAKAELALRKQDLIDAESELKVQRYTLIRYIYPGMPGVDVVEILPTSRPSVDLAFDADLTTRTRLALQSRPELRQAELLIESDRLETVVTRNGRLPKLQLFINLGKSGYADTFRGSFRDSDGPSYDASVGIEFSTALGIVLQREVDQIAQSTLAQSEEALANLKDLVRF
jgi:Outer membrane protein